MALVEKEFQEDRAGVVFGAQSGPRVLGDVIGEYKTGLDTIALTRAGVLVVEADVADDGENPYVETEAGVPEGTP